MLVDKLRVMPRKDASEKPEKRERLTLSALATYDDVLTDALVDTVGTALFYSA